MSFPPEKPFNPPVSKIPILGPSSGNPKAFRDPNSTASVGKNIQAMTDQASADTLYDAPMNKEGFRNERSEGFRNELYSPWILRSEACRKDVVQEKEGFRQDTATVQGTATVQDTATLQGAVIVLVFLGLTALTCGFISKR